MDKRRLPLGIEFFDTIRKEQYYYIDKTGLISDLEKRMGKVNLFTRPRRFGKTLNMSMLQCFYELGTDSSLFDGLRIAHDKDLCEQCLGQFPVIFLTLKDVEGLAYSNAEANLSRLMQLEALRHEELKTSDKLLPEELAAYTALCSGLQGEALADSLRLLTQLLARHYEREVVVLIDEYDVPLAKAYHAGYYKEMAALLRTFLGKALKTNSYLYRAVLTGCLHVSKESIFTGLNNFIINTIVDEGAEEYFGFTPDEVDGLMHYYAIEKHASVMKEWYDGYRFGKAEIYCPWDVINYANKLRFNNAAAPEAFWVNTSGNELVQHFVHKADKNTKNELEQLLEGECIEKSLRLDLTYDELDRSIDNLWSVLFTTGYLTTSGGAVNGMYKLKLPNREVREVFLHKIKEWFDNELVRKSSVTNELNQALARGDAVSVEKKLNLIMSRMISIMDTKAKEAQKENFYHGLLLVLLRSEPEWLVLSNAESGDGFSDILVETEEPDTGIVIEVKYAAGFGELDGACKKALEQIRVRRYDERLRNEGRTHIYAYAIAFHKKRCRIAVEIL